MKIDYNKKMYDQIELIAGKKPTLLLQACCAPCSSSVLERLLQYFDVTIFYYNPNTYPQKEFEKRKEEFSKLTEYYKNKLKVINVPYDHNEFLNVVKGYEKQSEGGDRCKICYELRLQKTLNYAVEHNFDFFASTLSVSPHKNSEYLNDIGELISKNSNTKWLYNDFKKQNGYKRSLILSDLLGFYRQNYCGCEFSLKNNI